MEWRRGLLTLSFLEESGVGFVIRPLGGFLIGRFGDRHGRKPALLLLVLAMAIGTGVIGVIPTYAQIGIAAPIILTLARLLQGFSAGGEWGGAATFIVEWAPRGRRGLYGGIHVVSTYFGLAAGSGVAAALSSGPSAGSVMDWGWRVPFLIGALIGPLALLDRRRINESRVFVESQAHSLAVTAPTRPVLLIMTHTFCFAAFCVMLPIWGAMVCSATLDLRSDWRRPPAPV
ncbi:MFS transporter [Acidisphaera sp. L21]|uniref:MFS transporter n=1 Tax=Acidisphaera sp. L21 TaxID=1641851 RepID=UPI00131A6E23|nr:MFS transporter [Acidisphaera sp. L21]